MIVTTLDSFRPPTYLDWFNAILEVAGHEAIVDPFHITGWRNLNTRINAFNDFITVSERIDSVGNKLHVFKGTTLPGLPMLLKPINTKGTAVMVPGFYKNCYALGLHKNKEALVQVSPIKVFRDANRNDIFDMDESKIEEGMFGINIHRAGKASKIIGNWSAGCQVLQNEEDFEKLIRLCKRSYKCRFSYSLIGFRYV